MSWPIKHFIPGNLNRRSFLKGSAAIAASSVFPHLVQASAEQSSERTLSFINLHTDEKLRCCYWANGNYDLNSLNEINHILRDHRTNDIHEMDAGLIDLLHNLHEITGSKSPFHIISAYRSPKTNKKLRQKSNGVAKRSLHAQR